MDQENAANRKRGLAKASTKASKPDVGTSLEASHSEIMNLDGMSFEQAIAELEGLVAGLERGDLALADALKAYQRGSALMRHAQGMLDQVQEQIDVIESGQVRSVDRASLISQTKD